MSNRRRESYPSLTAREHWRDYLLGMGTETLFILALVTMGLLLALIASAVWL